MMCQGLLKIGLHALLFIVAVIITDTPKPETKDIDDYTPYLEEDGFNVIDQLSYEELLGCISMLTPQYRMVFNLYVIDGYKHAEIADLLKISEGTSKSNLSKAKRTLQNILKDKYEIQSSSH